MGWIGARRQAGDQVEVNYNSSGKRGSSFGLEGGSGAETKLIESTHRLNIE